MKNLSTDIIKLIKNFNFWKSRFGIINAASMKSKNAIVYVVEVDLICAL